MWLSLNALNVRSPDASFRLKPEATHSSIATILQLPRIL